MRNAARRTRPLHLLLTGGLLLLLLCLLPGPAQAAEGVSSGFCGGEGDGTNLTWTLDSSGTLTISGTGAMRDFAATSQPWFDEPSPLRTLVLEEGITTIGDHAFESCTGLTGSLTLPESVTAIGNAAFYGCRGLTGALRLPEGLRTIETCAFHDCRGLTGELVLPAGIQTMGSSAFSFCAGLTGLTIPSGITAIPSNSFERCTGLRAVTIPEGVTTIGDHAFRDCASLADIALPRSVTTIGDFAFYRCTGLAGLALPDSVGTIGSYAFYGCAALTGELVLPSSVTAIGKQAFRGCTGLSGQFYFRGSAPTVGDDPFDTGSTLYRLPASPGWTGSAAYDAAAGTWHGYPLRTWDGSLLRFRCGTGTPRQVTVTLTGGGTGPVTAALAAYDAAGRLVAIDIQTADPAHSGITLTVARAAGDIALAQGFLLSPDTASPVADPWQQQITDR